MRYFRLLMSIVGVTLMMLMLPMLELLEIFLYFVLVPLIFLGMIWDGFYTLHEIMLEKWAFIKVLIKDRVDFWRQNADTSA